ncbi:MAG: alginate lyase family protein [Anaerolineae bacterium]|nr:alginate lyase family protein [Anaerolineae bacterium]
MNKQQSVPARHLAQVTWQRILKGVQARTAPTRPRTIKVGSSIQDIAAQIRVRQIPRFYGLIPEQAALLAKFFPEACRITLDQADKIKSHRFDVLGFGEYQLDTEIDWHTDFRNEHTWPVEHFTRLKLADSKGGYDVRIPWELSRFYHAVRLGQAYLYTLNESYAQEIVDQITHWIKTNPYEFGVNWADPMTVAIRTVNWIWAYYCIIESEALTPSFLALWLASLREHGEYLLKRLDASWPHTSRLIVNLAGLAYLGILFPEFPEAARWKSVGLQKLWEELERQVYPDGMSSEASTSYHRLITETALSVAGLCVINGIPLLETVQARLRSMLDVIMTYTQPDGMAPNIGDAGDDRLHILTVYSDSARVSQDHRHLLALGSLILERELSEWAGFIEPTTRGWSIAAGEEWQDAFWCFASDAAARFTDVLTRTVQRPDESASDNWVDVRRGVRVQARALARRPVGLQDVVDTRGFEAGGLYVMRNQDFHLAIDAGPVGQDGAGGYAHNDTLGITLAAYGKIFLIDPGSYLYTSDPPIRNKFRSTAYHNTLQIANEEINRIPDDNGLFRLTEDAHVTIHHWISQTAYDLFDASHNGYARLNPGVVHRRQIWFDKVAKLWVLHDQLRAASEPEGDTKQEAEVSLWFHFNAMPIRMDRTNNAVRTESEQGANLIVLPLGDFPLKLSLEDGWQSPRYGNKEKSPVARFSGNVKLPADLVLMLYPHQMEVDFKVVRAAGRSALISFKKVLTPLPAPMIGIRGASFDRWQPQAAETSPYRMPIKERPEPKIEPKIQKNGQTEAPVQEQQKIQFKPRPGKQPKIELKGQTRTQRITANKPQIEGLADTSKSKKMPS